MTLVSETGRIHRRKREGGLCGTQGFGGGWIKSQDGSSWGGQGAIGTWDKEPTGDVRYRGSNNPQSRRLDASGRAKVSEMCECYVCECV